MRSKLFTPRLLIAAAVIIILSSRLQAQGQWEVVSSLSRGLFGAAAVEVNGQIYVLGGYSDSVQSSVDWIQKFNPLTGKLTNVARMKKRRIYLFAAVSGTDIYYLGGELSSSGHQANGILEKFNTLNNTVTAVDTNKKFNRLAMTGLIRDSMLYLIGGEQIGSSGSPGTINPYLMEYSLNKKEITYNYTSMFSGYQLRSGQMAALRDEYIYIFGGAFNTVLSEVYRYHIPARQLRRVYPNMLVPRAFGCSALVPSTGEYMLLGGFNESTFALNTVEKFRLSDSTSIANSYIASLNFRRKSFMTASSGGFIYVFGGRNDFNQPVRSIERFQIFTGAEEPGVLPELYSLGQNYPNPFNPATRFSYTIPARSTVSLTVYDALGSVVSVIDEGNREPGVYEYVWNGVGLPSGIYYCELRALPAVGGDYFRQIRKMILLK
ncbi:MAG: T9SS type A sorting domain-containing protein [Ignavibacteriaceae bacterium]|nr:T9SS type A sorting domain-containing protein [Ignavibacteriaceae bacterium]